MVRLFCWLNTKWVMENNTFAVLEYIKKTCACTKSTMRTPHRNAARTRAKRGHSWWMEDYYEPVFLHTCFALKDVKIIWTCLSNKPRWILRLRRSWRWSGVILAEVRVFTHREPVRSGSPLLNDSRVKTAEVWTFYKLLTNPQLANVSPQESHMCTQSTTWHRWKRLTPLYNHNSAFFFFYIMSDIIFNVKKYKFNVINQFFLFFFASLAEK